MRKTPITKETKPMPTAKDIEYKLTMHEAVCAERYLNIESSFKASNARLKRIETLLITAAGGVVASMGTVIAMLFHIIAK
jgi:hypothetical protein